MLYPLQETVLISVSVFVLFGTAVGLATFIDQCDETRRNYRGYSYYYDSLPDQIKVPVQATAVS